MSLETSMGDEFTGGNYDAWWDSEMKALSLVEYPPASGNYVSVAGADTNVMVTPPGVSISGDFVFEVVFQLGNVDMPPAANESVSLTLFKSSDSSNLCDVSWYLDRAYWRHAEVPQDIRDDAWSAYKEVTMKIERVGDTITGYWYNTGTSLWEAFTDPIVYSDPIYIKYNGADYNGVSSFSFQSDGGLPYPIKRTQFGAQISNQIIGQI